MTEADLTILPSKLVPSTLEIWALSLDLSSLPHERSPCPVDDPSQVPLGLVGLPSFLPTYCCTNSSFVSLASVASCIIIMPVASPLTPHLSWGDFLIIIDDPLTPCLHEPLLMDKTSSHYPGTPHFQIIMIHTIY